MKNVSRWFNYTDQVIIIQIFSNLFLKQFSAPHNTPTVLWRRREQSDNILWLGVRDVRAELVGKGNDLEGIFVDYFKAFSEINKENGC
jgi:hypothetical protein